MTQSNQEKIAHLRKRAARLRASLRHITDPFWKRRGNEHIAAVEREIERLEKQ